MNKPNSKSIRAGGFSLVELVIVIVIIGIIAAIAVPRFSAATTNANAKQVSASQAILQNAIDLYEAEHTGANMWNGGSAGTPTSVTVGKALLLGSLASGASGSAYGPYMRSLPPNMGSSEAHVGIEVDDGSTPTCTAAVAGDGLGQTWTASECGWTLELATLKLSPK